MPGPASPAPVRIEDLRSRALFETEPPQALFHYTDFDGVAGILASRSLWLSKISTLNDTSEVQLAVRGFRERALEAAEELPREAARLVRDVLEALAPAPRTNVCVASFGEQDDQLEHWRSYANDGRGIALGFDARALRRAGERHDVRLVRCIYQPELHARILDELLEVLLGALRRAPPRGEAAGRALCDAFTELFLMTAPVLKDEHFGGEREWRLVSRPRGLDDPRLMAFLSGEQASVHFELPLCEGPPAPVTLVSSVTVGPTREPDNVADAVTVLARRTGFELPEIRFSAVPYRPRR